MDHQASILALEGRLIAHRKLLARIVAALPGAPIADWLDQVSIPHDGQEDPGAVLDDGAALELAMADELRLLRERLTALRDQPEPDI